MACDCKVCVMLREAKAEISLLRSERDAARHRAMKYAVTLDRIHALLYPPAMKLDDGRVASFGLSDEMANAVLQRLSDEIRQIQSPLPPADPRVEEAKSWCQPARCAARMAFDAAKSSGATREEAMQAGYRAGLDRHREETETTPAAKDAVS